MYEVFADCVQQFTTAQLRARARIARHGVRYRRAGGRGGAGSEDIGESGGTVFDIATN